jgi:hypothetical protein
MSSSSTHPNGGALPPPNYQNSRSRNYVTDSKADLVSMELSEARTQNVTTFTSTAWNKRTRLEKTLIFVVGLLIVALAIVLSISISQGVSHLSLISENNGDSCNTPGCITAAHTLIQNMDPSADPCEDFYQYACGGFEERVS